MKASDEDIGITGFGSFPASETDTRSDEPSATTKPDEVVEHASPS